MDVTRGRQVLVVVVIAAMSGAAHAAVLCKKPSGVVVVRDECKRKETALDLVQLGAAPSGDPGPPTGAAGGDLSGSYPDPAIGDGKVTSSKLAAGAVNSGNVDSAQVQLRVSGTCSSGEMMTGVNADGTVTCAAPNPSGTTLECVNTTVSSFNVSANSTSFFNNPTCPVGYVATTPYCWTAATGVLSQGSGYNANAVGNATFCAWQNTTATSQTVFGGNVCCR
jgi:hypothetical protein